jgi:hypothetical protein
VDSPSFILAYGSPTGWFYPSAKRGRQALASSGLCQRMGRVPGLNYFALFHSAVARKKFRFCGN